MKTQARIFTIRARLALIALGVLATMLAMSGAAWFGFSEYRRGQIAIAGLDGADGHLQQLLRGLAEFVITEGTGTSAQIVAKSVAAFRAEWETLPTTLADYPEVQEQLAARAQPLWEALRTGAGKLTVLEEGEVSTDDAAAMVLFGRTLQVGDKLGATLDTTRQEVADRALARASSTARALVGGLAVAFAVVVLLLAALYVSIVKPVTGLARVASRVARGDFSQHLTLKRGDEIGALADAFRSMGENLRRTIGALQELATEVSGRLEAASEEASRTRLQISDSVGDQQRSIARTLATCEEMHQEMAEVAAATESLTVYAQQSAAASSEISASIRSVAEQAELHHQAATVAGDVTGQMIGSLDAVAENLQELTSASQQIAAGASQMMATTDDTARQARESAGIVRTVSEITTTRGAQAITDALEGMDVIERSVTTLVEVLDNLGEHSGEIGRVVGVIRDVADQTGLLALNAAILAAQAGERGRGFAVVADEVKDLAARTSDSTEEVEEMIAAIQAKTQESVAQARAGLETVGHGKQQVRALAQVLTEIRDQSVAAAKNSDTIVRAASEQSDVAGQIATAIHSMSDRLVNVSQRAEGMEAQSRGLRGEMEKIREGARSVKTATAAQLLASEQIAETSHGVAEHATQIMQSIRVQQEGSQHVSAAMVPIDRTAEQLVTRVAGMDRTVTALVDQAEALIEGIRRFTV